MIEQEWERNKYFGTVKNNFSIKIRAIKIDWMFDTENKYAE